MCIRDIYSIRKESPTIAAEKIIQVPGQITVGELAELLGLPATTLVGELFKNGIAATLNQRIDVETAQIIVGCLLYTSRCV